MDPTWRALNLADMEAMAGLLAAAEAADPTGEYQSAEDVREQFTMPAVDLARGTTSAWNGDRLVAYAVAVVRDAVDPVHQMRVEACVHPGYRDDAIGALAEAKEQGYQRASLSVDVDNANDALSIYCRCGFEVAGRWLGYVLANPLESRPGC